VGGWVGGWVGEWVGGSVGGWVGGGGGGGVMEGGWTQRTGTVMVVLAGGGVLVV
jgi:hypothetical protein